MLFRHKIDGSPSRRPRARAVLVAAALSAGLFPRTGAADEGDPASFHSFGLALGYSRLAVLDRRASDLTYVGHTPSFGVSWDWRRGGNIAAVRLHAGIGPYFARDAPHRPFTILDTNLHGTEALPADVRGRVIQVGLSISYLRRLIRPAPARTGLALGATVSEDLTYAQGFVTPGTLAVAALAPTLALERPFGRRTSVTLGVRVPVVAAVTRMPYHGTVSLPGTGLVGGFFRQGTEVKSLGRFVQVDVHAEVQRLFGRRWLLGLRYEAVMTRDRDWLPLRSVQHTLLAHVALAFGSSGAR